MANRDSLHQQTARHRDLGTGIQLYDIPLLPYERQLIDILDWNEEDYRRFSYLAAKRGQVRPAAYAHIPDIQNAEAVWIPIVISLVVGAVSTAASILLAPKPKAPGSSPDNRVSRRRLGGRSGQDRFSPTTGFDTQAELADYASPIPIIFGQYTGATGGIVASPSLVWSRAFSLGSQQSVKLLFVLGEQGLEDGIARPDLNGIFLGNSALDASYEHAFAFYWKRNSNAYARIKAANLAYGTRGTLASGDIEADDDIFLCPTSQGLADTGFSGAHSPSSSTQFGVHSAIPNATNYRVNWRIISIPKLEDQEDDPKDRLLSERIKIAGDYGLSEGKVRGQGQKGVGRNYGRRMGITHLNGVPVSDNGSTPTEVRTTAVGDIATFTIAPGELPADLYHLDSNAVSVDDINSAIASSRRGADDALQIGETIAIGRTAWVVQSRALSIWTEGSRQEIQLRCVETFGGGLGSSIGLVSERMISRGVYNDDNGTTDARNALNMNAGTDFYPLLKASFAVVRNTRACEATEIGIRSQVWNRANGLANFATIPSPTELREAESDKISFEAGTMSLYFKRTSVWTIFLRPAGTDENGTEYAWVPLGEQFCVTGENPQDQYNYIRFKHPERRQYEYKFVPKSGADVARHSPADAQFIRLNAKTNNLVGGQYKTAYGTFDVGVTGEYVTVGSITFNPEMTTDPVITPGSTTYDVPAAVEVETYIPETVNDLIQATSVGFNSFLPDGVTVGRKGATNYALFGRADYMGLTRSAQITTSLSDDREITIEFNGVVNENYPDNHPFFPGFRAWNFTNISVVSSSGGFNEGQVIDIPIDVAGNPRATPYGLTTGGVRLTVLSTAVSSGSTFRQVGSAALESNKGRSAAFAYELLGNQQSFSLGHVKEETIDVSSDSGSSAKIVVTGTVVSRPSLGRSLFPGQTQGWDLKYTVNRELSSGGWVSGESVSYPLVVTPGNPFKDTSTFTGVVLKVVSVVTVEVPPKSSGGRLFEESSQVSDISFYGDLLGKSNDSSPEHEITYVNEMVANASAPEYKNLTICGLALKSSRNFASVDQLRVWLANGVSVRKFQADALSDIGPSNKFTDLVYYLLTDKTAGVGGVVSAELIRTEDFPATSQFLKANKLFFDGAIDSPTNLRQFISDTAPFFLCNFVISDGKFSLVPALPTDLNGNITQQPVVIQALFTSGNIIEDSFSLEYLSSEERKDFQAVVRYRQEQRNQLPEEKTLVVRFAESGSDQYPIEAFDLTQFCTSRDHAFLVAKFFLSLRRRVTHTVKFRTSPFGISLAPGNFIRVVTEASPYQSARNGTISADGTIVSATAITDGTYSIVFFRSDDDEVTPATMTVAGGKAVETTLYDSLFTISETSISSNVYMVEQLTLAEDGMVDVVATEFPTTSTFNSLMAQDVLTDSAFTTEG